MAANPPVDVQELGQSIWLDYIHRRDLKNGTLKRHIEQDGVVGMTSNPTIFQKAIGESDDYDEAIGHLLELEALDIYERLAIEDIQQASDLLRPVFERSGGRDGFVSLEVSPLLAHDTEGTVAEAQRLYEAVDRPNLMIKIPATQAGIPAIEETIAAGINVNVTLIFAIKNYEEVAEAFIRGLERRLDAGQEVTGIASVASFFISRIDSMIDRILENNIRAAQVHGDTGRITLNRQLLGQAAVASARLAYRRFVAIFQGQRFARLRAAGAQVQRPLWASTSTKNPSYPDTKYVDSLIGPDTVNTLPPSTLRAFKDHGRVAETLTRNGGEHMDPQAVMDQLAEAGIDMAHITRRLQEDGVDAFTESFQDMIKQVGAKRLILKTGFMERQKLALGIYTEEVQQLINDMEKDFTVSRLWNRDGSLWKQHGPTIVGIRKRLGWLDVLNTIDIERLHSLKEQTRGSEWQHVVLLGMGGSSLAPEVLSLTFGPQEGFPSLIVLDSTDPARVLEVERSIDLARTLFIVASKSGGTVETWSFYQYFYQQTGERGEQFIAITDPGSQLEAEAREKNFRELFLNPADIGGRYSALSYFGLVPAALMGLDLERLWESARTMINTCSPDMPALVHPGVLLGAVIGQISQQGRDKLVLFCTQSITSFGSWAEQLVAESLGKEGRGVVPVVGSTVGKPHDYPTDRLFVYLKVEGDADVEEMDEGVRTLREAGHPRITLILPDAYAIAGEFFRWEFATAIAGTVLKVNPFDEPNVTEAKEATKRLLAYYEANGRLPTADPVMEASPLTLYANGHTITPLRELCRSHDFDAGNLSELLAAQMIGTRAGDYFAILAYLTPTPEIAAQLHDIQRRLRHSTRRAVTVGFGPRYLHSTGQLHKGGPNKGVFLVLTVDHPQDIDIPGAPYSFGTLFDAQATGDMEALQAHHCRVLRLHLNGDIAAGLEAITAAIELVEGRRQ